MKLLIGSIIAVSLLVGVLAIGCDSSTSTAAPTNTTSLVSTVVNDFNRVNSASFKSANGLNLSLALDAKTFKPGYTINIVVSEWNTLSKTNDVPVSDKWPVPGLSVDICGTRSFPFGVAILRGDYSAGNVETATPLILYNPNGIVQGCLPPVVDVTAFHFKPSSDIATLDGTVIDQSATFEISTEVSVWSYWAGNPPNAVSQNLEPGVYTVVAGDEWGALVVLHFTITE
jgi:hypothetical protein